MRIAVKIKKKKPDTEVARNISHIIVVLLKRDAFYSIPFYKRLHVIE